MRAAAPQPGGEEEEADTGATAAQPRWEATAARIATIVAVLGAAVFILLQLQPGLLLADTTPAGGDMGAHVWGPAHVRDHVLPHWRVTGWANDWYAGFPSYHFYFPLPTLLIILADVVLPYTVAFKLVSVSGLVTMPVSAWAMGRMLGLRFPAPALFAVATVPFVFDRFHTIWGGNAAATLAGEFSFSIALSIALLFIGVLARALQTGRGRSLAALLLAATALCHLLPAAFAVIAAAVLFASYRPDLRRLGLVVTVGAVAFAIAAFWFVPFMARLPYSNDMGWERTQEYVKNLLPWLRTDDPAVIAAARHLKVTMPLALLGMIIGCARRNRGAFAVGCLAISVALAFLLITKGPIWNARMLPFWYLTTYLLAAYAAAELATFLGRAISWFANPPASAPAPPPPSDDEEVPELPASVTPPAVARADADPNIFALVAPVGLLVIVIVAVGIPLGLFRTGRIELPGDRSLPFVRVASKESNFVPAWAAWNYSGYERKADYGEYRELVTAMADVGSERGCGRAMWEYEPELNRFGTPMALMLLPYWTDGCIGSMEGLYFESSASVPYHFLNQSELSRNPSRAMRDLPYRALDVNSGVEHLQLMGVRYYMAVTPDAQAQAAANTALELVATTAPRNVTYGSTVEQRFWQVYEVADSPLVAPLSAVPSVAYDARTKDGWLDAVVPWYQDPSRWSRPFADDGPSEWQRTDDPASAALRRVQPAGISDIELDDDRIRFRVDRVGAPVVVRLSYFPNWKAKGADGPWRISPNFMVVVPTSEEVELRYGWTGVDLTGWVLTFLGLAAAGLLARRRLEFPGRRDRRRAVLDTQRRRVDRGDAPGDVRVSVVVPAYDEGEQAGEAVRELRAALSSMADSGGVEIVVVDDGSPDDTAEHARAAGADQVIVLPANRGKGAAVRAGVLAARGRTIAYTDADLSYPPDQLLGLVKLVEDGWDMVVGSRRHIDTTTLVRARRLREVSGRVFNLLTSAVLLGQYRDTQCGLKAFRSDVAHVLFSKQRLDGFAFDVELFHLAERYGISMTEVPVTLANSSRSTVQVVRAALRMMRDLGRVRRWANAGTYDLAGDDESVLARPAGEGRS